MWKEMTRVEHWSKHHPRYPPTEVATFSLLLEIVHPTRVFQCIYPVRLPRLWLVTCKLSEREVTS